MFFCKHPAAAERYDIARMYSCGIKYAVACGRHGTYAACVNDGKLGTTVGRVSVDVYI